MKSIGQNDPNTIFKSLDFWRWASRKSCFCIYQPGFLLCSIMYHIVPLYPLSFLAVSVIKLQPIHPFREKQPKTQKVLIGEKSPNISRILMLLIHRCCSNLPFLDQIPTTFPQVFFPHRFSPVSKPRSVGTIPAPLPWGPASPATAGETGETGIGYPLVNKHRPWKSPIFNGN